MPLLAIANRRWLDLNDGPQCVVYETDGGWHRTLCGKLVQGGTIRKMAARLVARKCRRCAVMIRKVVGEE